MTRTPDITLAICTRNAAGRIAPVLAALAQQAGVPQLAWEVLLIDNASTDGTGDLATQYAAPRGLALRVVREERLGLAYARQRAAAAARGGLLCFVDDDNIVAADWTMRLVEFMNSHPRAGLVGGRIRAEFADPRTRPVDFDTRFARPLACWDLGDQPFAYPAPVHYPPCGAGLTVRTAVLRAVFEHCGSHLTDRAGGRLISGGDYELGLLILKLGWEAWYVPTLRLTHVMPPGRLTEDYLRRIKVGNVQSEHWLNYLRGTEPRRSRVSYLREWLGWKRRGVGWRIKAALPGAARVECLQRAEEMALRADGAKDLGIKYPFPRVERALEQLQRDPAVCPPAAVIREDMLAGPATAAS